MRQSCRACRGPAFTHLEACPGPCMLRTGPVSRAWARIPAPSHMLFLLLQRFPPSSLLDGHLHQAALPDHCS